MFNMKKIRVVYCATLLGLSVYSGGTDVYANRMPNITIENKVGDYDKIETMLAEYRFEDAIKEIQKQQATAKRRKKPTEALDELLDRANVGIQMLRGTEQVTFIDSMVVDKADFLKAIKIHPESGQIDSYAHFFKKTLLKQLGMEQSICLSWVIKYSMQLLIKRDYYICRREIN